MSDERAHTRVGDAGETTEQASDEVVDPREQPAAGGAAGLDEPVQGPGEPDSH